VELVQIVDMAMAEAVRKSGAWIACRPGCAVCCLGPFPITLSDADRLRAGFGELQQADPARAARVMTRVRAHVEADEASCPVLDPESQTCDLYAARPLTCRMFGPAVQTGGDAVGACELCYHGAADEEIAACAVAIDLGPETGAPETTVALALGL
jgi:Fe-S-cluster containining protein